VKVVQAAATNLDQDADFAKRMKLADLMLKEKDIDSNERIAVTQMQNRQPK